MENNRAWASRVAFMISVYNETTEDRLVKIGYTNKFDETLDEVVALQNVLQNARHNLPPGYEKQHEYFAWNFGPGVTINTKRNIMSTLRLAGFQRSDVMNVQGSHTVDYFDFNGENEGKVMNIVNDYLFENDIILNDYFLTCPVCGDYTYNTDTYSCSNTQFDRDCDDLTIIHEECMDEYLQTHQRVSRDIESEEWLCDCCL